MLEGSESFLIFVGNTCFLLLLLVGIFSLSEVFIHLLFPFFGLRIKLLLDLLDLILQSVELLLSFSFETLPVLISENLLPPIQRFGCLLSLADDVSGLALNSLFVMILQLHLLLVEAVIDLSLVVGQLSDGLSVQAELLLIEFGREQFSFIECQVSFNVCRLHDEVLVFLLDGGLFTVQLSG